MSKKSLVYRTTSVWCVMSVLVLTNIATVQACEVGLKNVTANIVDDSVAITVDGNDVCYDGSYKATMVPQLAGASVHYTADGTNPTCSSTLYTGPFALAKGTTVLKAVSCHDAFQSLPVSKTVTAPSSDCAGVNITYTGTASCDKDDFKVTMNTSLPDSSIYYTTNGTDPVCAKTGTKYAGTFALGTTSTVKAVACLSSFQSEVASKRIVVPTNPCEVPCQDATLKISRVYFAPDHDHTGSCENDNEWVELYNPTNCVVNTTGWQLCNTGTASKMSDSCTTANYCDTIGNYNIPAGGYAIVAAKSSTWQYWSFSSGTVKIALGQKLGYDGLKNSGDNVLLKKSGAVVDYVGWSKYTTSGDICANSGHSCSYVKNVTNKDAGEGIAITSTEMKDEDGEEYELSEETVKTDEAGSKAGATTASAAETTETEAAAATPTETVSVAPVIVTDMKSDLEAASQAIKADETVMTQSVESEAAATAAESESAETTIQTETAVVETVAIETTAEQTIEQAVITPDADASITFNLNA